MADPFEYISLLRISPISKFEFNSVLTLFNSPFFLIENNVLYVVRDVIMTLQTNQKFYLALNRNFIPLVEAHSFYHDLQNQIYNKNIILIPYTLAALSE